MEKPTSKTVTCIKGFLIFLVVTGHFMQLLTSSMQIGAVVQGIVLSIYSFHMPAFVFLSGYLSKNVKKRRMKAFDDLLIPFIVFQMVFAVIGIASRSGQHALANIFYPEFALWYLLALFVWRILLPDMIRVRGILIISLIISVATGYFYGMNNAFAAQRMVGFLFYFIAGFFTNEYLINRLQMLKKLHCIIIMIFEVGIWIVLVDKKVIEYDRWLEILSHTAYYEPERIYLIGIQYTLGIIVSLVNLILVFNIFNELDSKLFKTIGTATFPIYISHAALFILVKRLCMSIENETIKIVLVIVSIVLCNAVFSLKQYVQLFENTMRFLKSLICISNSQYE